MIQLGIKAEYESCLQCLESYALVKIEILGEQGYCTYIYRHECKLAYIGYAELISLIANYTSASLTPSQNRAFKTA